MTNAAETLKPQLARLPEEDRAELAYFLLRSLPPDTAEDLGEEDEALKQMLRERIDEVESGRVRPIPADVVHRELREKYP